MDNFDELIKAAMEHCGEREAEELKKLDTSGVDFPRLERDISGTLICPGHPKLCLGSGDFPGFECCCDECDYYLECFPEWEKGGADGEQGNV